MKTFRNLLSTLALISLCMSCKKVTVQSTTTAANGDTTTVVKTMTSGIEPDIETDSAKVRWERAKERLRIAVSKGDQKATDAAQKTADEAEEAWNRLKANVNRSANKTNEDLKKAKEDLKENYNEALEKAKAK